MKLQFKTSVVSSVVLAALGFVGAANAGAPLTIAAKDTDLADSLIVKYKTVDLNTAFTATGTKNARAAMQTLSGRTGERLEFFRRMYSGAQVVKLNGERRTESVEALARQMMAEDSNIEYAEPNRRMFASVVPNDSYYNDQWHYFETAGGINAPAAWDITTGRGVTVAVVDTGYRPHPDLVANIVGGADMITDSWTANDGNGRDSDAKDAGDWFYASECRGATQDQGNSWHGTHVAGTVAAVSNNRSGVTGVAYGAKVVPVRVLGKCGGTMADINDGIVWAAGGNVSGMPNNPNPARVINLSLGGEGSCSNSDQRAIDAARRNGAVVVVASGNSNDDVRYYNPGNCQGVIAVASTDRRGNRSSFSNYGSGIDVAAPGSDILSTWNTGQTNVGRDDYSQMSGTSMAAPHVAGVAALMLSVNPNLNPDQVESILKQTARRFPGSCNGCGTGIIDALAAVNKARGQTGTTPSPDEGGSKLSNGVAKNGIKIASGAEQFYTFDVPAGASKLKFDLSGGSGDADMYVKFSAKPTDSSYDCRPYRNGNSEVCDISSVRAGTYHIRLKAASAVNGAKLVASFVAGGNTGTPPGADSGNILVNGQAKTNVAIASGKDVVYRFDVPAGAKSVSITTAGGTGDADLYVKIGSTPTNSVYDCRPYTSRSDEYCEVIRAPQAGAYYVRVVGASAVKGLTVRAVYTR